MLNIRVALSQVTGVSFVAVISVALWAGSAQANELRDPTTPLNKTSIIEGRTELVLAAIVSVGGENFAILNGQRVYKGSVIEGVTIEEINAKHIVYSHKGQRYTLNMRLSLSK